MSNLTGQVTNIWNSSDQLPLDHLTYFIAQPTNLEVIWCADLLVIDINLFDLSSNLLRVTWHLQKSVLFMSSYSQQVQEAN